MNFAPMTRCRFPWHIGLLLLVVLLPFHPVQAAVGDILFSDTFERSTLGSDWSASNSSMAGIGTYTANSGTRSLYTRWGAVTVTSKTIDLSSTPGAELSMWIRIGDDIPPDVFSEWPDSSGEDLEIQYLNSSSTWVTLETFVGGDHVAGTIYNRTYTLPSSALHSNFRIRIAQTGGSGNDYDYYHIDDVILTETAALPSLAYPFCDDFESGINNWEITAITGSAGIGSQTYSSASNSLYLRWGEVNVSSLDIDTSSATSPYLTLWVRRGSDVFSEYPDTNEDLRIEYFNNSGTWTTLDTLPGGGTAGEMFDLAYALPADARHSNFKVRLYMEQGSGSDYDYWHVDDICVSPPVSAIAEYHLDETSWGTVTDTSGSGNDGSTSGTVTPTSTSPVVSGTPGTCGYADIADNSSTSTKDAIDTGVDIDSMVGNQGTISFWYKSNVRWNGNNGNRQLFDASNATTDKYFHLTLLSEGGGNNGILQFGLEDSADSDFRIETGSNNIAANTWAHVAVTWDLSANEVNIYVNGNLQRSSSISSNGTLGDMDTLYIGDNRSTYLPPDSTANSANGSFDEVRIYDYVQSQTEIQADMNATHACDSSTIDHFRIIHDGEALTCQPESITIQACQSADCSTLYTGDVTLTLNPSGWVGGDTVTFNGGETTLELRHTTAETVTLGVSSATPSPLSSEECYLSGVSGSCNMVFYDSGFVFDVPALSSCTTSSAVTISAVRKDDTTQQCVPAFSNRSENINFWSTYSNPSSGTKTVSVSGTAITTSAPGTAIPLTFDSNGESTFTVTYPDAGLIQLDASYTGSGDEAGLLMTGNDSFVSVPAKFYVYSPDSGAACASGDATCSVFTKAGAPFNLNVRAACNDNTVTPNFIHSGITIGHNLVAPAAGVAGSISVGSVDIADADNGEVTIPNQSVSEVGVFTFTASSANTYFGETLPTSLSENIGRFIPARLLVTSNTPVFGNACNTGTTSYTYMGQNLVGALAGGFGFATDPVLNISAQDTAGNFTRNYAGNFWKLNDLLFNRTYTNQVAATASVLTRDASGGSATRAGDNYDATPPTLTISGDRFTYSQPANPENPFAALVNLDLTAADLTDSDGVCYDALNASCNTNDGDPGNSLTIANITGALLRYGRGYTRDVYGTNGSVGSSLVVPLRSIYYDDTISGWINNDDDSCTVVSYTNIDNGITSATLPASPLTLASGIGDLTVTVTADPGTIGGSTDYTFTWPAWLNGATNARATFGIFRGDDSYLYWNEQ